METKEQEKKTSPELEKLIEGLMHTYSVALDEQQKEDEFPPFEKQKVTQRWEYIRDKFGRRHGPYLYLYWKENRKLRKKYVGKSAKDYDSRQTEKTVNKLVGLDISHTQWRKGSFITEQIKKGNKLAEEYRKKLDAKQVSIEWAYKVVRDDILRSKKQAVSTIAEKYRTSPAMLFWNKGIRIGRGFDELLISGRFDSYINSEFR